MLSLQNISYRIAGRSLLENVCANIPAGHRVGLVGPNGAGKTTLFKIISGEIAPDDGEVAFIKGATLGYVKQDLPDEGLSLLDIVLAADTERDALLTEAETCVDPDRLGELYDRLNEIGAYEAPSRAATILSGLGFAEESQALPLSAFSGGWRTRVALACVLFAEPNILLLDEPTNHLDFESIIWLENFLMRYRHTVIMISHDREILNRTVDHILHLENRTLTLYTGNYDTFERTRAQKRMNQQALHEKQMTQKAHLMAFVERFRAKASKARQAQSRLKAIEKMDIVDAVIAERVTAFTFPEPKELKSPLIKLENVEAGYIEGKPVLRKLDLSIDAGDRIALLGANGNGKSTLVKILSERLKPMNGEIRSSALLRTGYFAQFQTDELDPARTPYQLLASAMKEPNEPKIRAMLAGFGFNKSKADTPSGELSGGEKARLLFCLMSFDAPHIMLLDEPTNHLDIEAREALIAALNNYSGAVILVSHDPHLVECVADRLWLVEGGRCTAFDDDLDAYRAHVLANRKTKRDTGKIREAQPAQEEPKDSQKAEKQAAQLESKLAELTQRRHALEGEMSECWQAGPDQKRLKELQALYEKLGQEIESDTKTLEKLIESL